MLIDLLCQYTSPQAVAAAALAHSSDAQPEYADVGLFGGSPMELQSLILTAIMHDIHEPRDFVYLGKHAFPICLPPLLEFAQTNMDGYVRDDRTVTPLVDVRPYCKMLGRSSSLHTPCHSMSRYVTACQNNLMIDCWQQQFFLPFKPVLARSCSGEHLAVCRRLSVSEQLVPPYCGTCAHILCTSCHVYWCLQLFSWHISAALCRPTWQPMPC